MNDVIDRLTDAMTEQNRLLSELKSTFEEWQAFLEEMLEGK